MAENNTDELISRKISILVERKRCLYDKKDRFYYIPKARENAFKAIAAEINSEFNKQFDWKSIKTRWENIRKYFAKKIHSQLGHFLSKELHYLIPHLKSSPPVAPNKRPVVTNERPVKTVNDVFHEEDEETLTLDDVMNTTKNIKEASTSTMNSTSTVQFQTENQKQERIKKVEEQQFSKKIIPPKDINYIKNADKLNMLEKSMQVAEKAMEGIQGLISTTSDNQQYDDYLISVRQSLMYIPERNLLQCTNGILTIIDSYISK